MIVDASAIVALFRAEDGHERLAQAIATAARPAIGAPTLVETCLVLVGRYEAAGRAWVDRIAADLTVLDFTPEHATVALGAFERFGKGRHPAALNFGDCLTYAVARVAGEPLLCVGDDFARTDLPLA